MNEVKDFPSNSVLEVKLDYIQKDIAVIKSDVKEIKSDYISRREHEAKIIEITDKVDTRFKANEENTKKLYTLVYWIGGLFGAATLASIFPKFISYFIK